jgi:hypothetical protein
VGLLASACGASPEREAQLEVRVLTAADRPAPSFFATVTLPDGRLTDLTCPPEAGEASGELRCTEQGFDVLDQEGITELTVRSRGNAFVSAVVEGAGGSLTLELPPLAPAEETADYATRLDGTSCSRELQELGLPFRSDLGESYSVKFYVRDLETEPRVYFQNTKEHPLHFDFARNVLGIPGTADQFASDTYSGVHRQALAGSLILYPAARGRARGAGGEIDGPWTLNFFPADTLTIAQIRLAHRLLEERLTCLNWTGPAKRLVYLPATAERETDAAAHDASFARSGIPWMSRAELLGGLRWQAMNDGVAYGTLHRFSPAQLAHRPVSFRDILLLSRIPNEPPLAGGTITEEFQTPLAHVNVAARSRGTPNLAYPEAFEDSEISPRVGKLVRFEVTASGFTIEDASSEQARDFWETRAPERYVPSFDSSATGVLSFADIGFADSLRVGAKAANLAELTHFLDLNAPAKGLALPFYYYEAFMSSSHTSSELCDGAQEACKLDGRDAELCRRARDICLPGDTTETLSEFVTRLVGDSTFNEDTALREAALAGVRYCIEHTPVDPDFGKLLDDRIFEVFENAKVKLRSSTNTEDLPDFSGAGLYESHAAYARGDKAASKVVTKVFSSVWSFRAFEERAFWNIDHEAVRLGCAINEAFVGELANGVLITQNIADPTTYGMYVNIQKGEASVTNPERGELPEIFSILADTHYQVVRSRFSSLSPDAPILSAEETRSLYEAGARAEQHFASLYGRHVVLDIEFKLTPDHQIVFKQARPYTSR